jgi:hypothetical protein
MIKLQKLAAFALFAFIFWMAMSISAGTWQFWQWQGSRILVTGICIAGAGAAIYMGKPRKYNKYNK